MWLLAFLESPLPVVDHRTSRCYMISVEANPDFRLNPGPNLWDMATNLCPIFVTIFIFAKLKKKRKSERTSMLQAFVDLKHAYDLWIYCC